MGWLDWTIVALYVAAMIVITARVSSRQSTQADYFLAGRRLGGTWLGFSILATQVSAISLISGPAFVAARPGGGLSWLQYEIAVPLASAVLLLGIAPAMRRSRATTIYEFVENRLGRPSGAALAISFLAARGIATGAVLYTTALLIAQTLGVPTALALLGISGSAVLYTVIGGIEADVWSDVMQLGVLLLALIAAVIICLLQIGGVEALLSKTDPERTRILMTDVLGFERSSAPGLLPMIAGGFVLYLSYYGCDQSQAQRLLSAHRLRDARWALILNGVLRMPLAAIYCVFGLALGVWLQSTDAAIAEEIRSQPDRLVPIYLMHSAPTGLRGLFVAGLLAASMSSFDSNFNSLSAVTLRDILRDRRSDTGVGRSRLYAAVWGVLATSAAFLFAGSKTTVIEAVNSAGSLLYGPVLALVAFAAFCAERRNESAPPRGAGFAVAFILGVAVNCGVWIFEPEVSWMWWNVLGFAVTAAGIGIAAMRGGDLQIPRWRLRIGFAEVALASISIAMVILFGFVPGIFG
ncbi:MAG: sodium/solute symporter [Planctomycetes bacterium]|nr:sodium/solute symporter [Planctomycetota bacterium]